MAGLRQRSVDMKRLCEELISHYRNLMLPYCPAGRLAGVPPEEEALYLEKAGRTPRARACARSACWAARWKNEPGHRTSASSWSWPLFALDRNASERGAGPSRPCPPQQPRLLRPLPPARRRPAHGSPRGGRPGGAPPSAQRRRTACPGKRRHKSRPVRHRRRREPQRRLQARPSSRARGRTPRPGRRSPCSCAEVPPPKRPGAACPARARKAQAAPAGQAQKFEPWPQVLAALERQDKC